MNVLWGLKEKVITGFSWKVIVLVSGTSIAQAIPILLTPVITRLYSPNDMGLLSLYVSVTALLIVFSTGKYEQAIILEEKEIDALKLTLLTIFIVTVFSIILIIPFIIYTNEISRWFNHEEISKYLIYVPFGVLFFGIYQVLNNYGVRNEKYTDLAVNRVLTSSTTGIMKVLLGILHFRAIGLILSTLVGQLISLILLAKSPMRNVIVNREHFRIRDLYTIAIKYKNFPLILMPSQAISVFRQQVPIIAIPILFNTKTLGFFSLAYLLVSLPGVMVTNAIADVFRQKAATEYRQRGKFDRILKITVLWMSIAGIFPYLIMLVFSPVLFSWLFGESWRVAGEYASIITISGYASFVLTSIDKAAVIRQASRYILGWQISFFICHLIAVLIVNYLSFSVVTYLYIYSIINVLHYMLDFLFQYHFSKGEVPPLKHR